MLPMCMRPDGVGAKRPGTGFLPVVGGRFGVADAETGCADACNCTCIGGRNGGFRGMRLWNALLDVP